MIHDFSRCVIRGNYGANPNDQKIGSIGINNTIIYNVDQTNVQGYYMFSFEKLQLNSFAMTKSTLYNMGEGLINMSTTLAAPTTAPTISFDYCTMNSIGGNTKYLFMDANNNKVTFSFTNSILANTPISASIQSAALRATGSGSLLSFSNNNYFKTLVTAGGNTALAYTGMIQNSNYQIDLGWTAATTNFLLTPTASNTAVFGASSNGSTVGDPRWAY